MRTRLCSFPAFLALRMVRCCEQSAFDIVLMGLNTWVHASFMHFKIWIRATFDINKANQRDSKGLNIWVQALFDLKHCFIDAALF